MACMYCDAPHVCRGPNGYVCNEHLLNPPPTQLDRIEARLERLEAAEEEPES